MKIIIGTKNQAKIDAVKEVFSEYPLFEQADIVWQDVPSGVSEQPMSLEETIIGAQNRAKQAYGLGAYRYGVGIESGIFPVPRTKTGYMDTSVCVIYDGQEFHMGMSSCFEYPKQLIRLVLDEGLNISDAAKRAGVTKENYIGHGEGMIGLLTKGRLNRKAYTKDAIVTALIHLENPHFYS